MKHVFVGLRVTSVSHFGLFSGLVIKCVVFEEFPFRKIGGTLLP